MALRQDGLVFFGSQGGSGFDRGDVGAIDCSISSKGTRSIPTDLSGVVIPDDVLNRLKKRD